MQLPLEELRSMREVMKKDLERLDSVRKETHTLQMITVGLYKPLSLSLLSLPLFSLSPSFHSLSSLSLPPLSLLFSLSFSVLVLVRQWYVFTVMINQGVYYFNLVNIAYSVRYVPINWLTQLCVPIAILGSYTKYLC